VLQAVKLLRPQWLTGADSWDRLLEMGRKTKPSWFDNFKISFKQWMGMKVVLCDSCK